MWEERAEGMHEEFADHKYNEGVSTWGSGVGGGGWGEGRGGEGRGGGQNHTSYHLLLQLCSAASPAGIHRLP